MSTGKLPVAANRGVVENQLSLKLSALQSAFSLRRPGQTPTTPTRSAPQPRDDDLRNIPPPNMGVGCVVDKKELAKQADETLRKRLLNRAKQQEEEAAAAEENEESRTTVSKKRKVAAVNGGGEKVHAAVLRALAGLPSDEEDADEPEKPKKKKRRSKKKTGEQVQPKQDSNTEV